MGNASISLCVRTRVSPKTRNISDCKTMPEDEESERVGEVRPCSVQ